MNNNNDNYLLLITTISKIKIVKINGAFVIKILSSYKLTSYEYQIFTLNVYPRIDKLGK